VIALGGRAVVRPEFPYHQGPSWVRILVVKRGAVAVALLIAGLSAAPAASSSEDTQLGAVRSRIRELEQKLGTLEVRGADVRRRNEELSTQLELAEARVQEVELVLQRSRDEAVRLRDGAAELALELEQRRKVVARHLEMMALLGRPGPLQLFFDGVRGGEVEKSVETVAALTSGQVRLMAEFEDVQRRHGARLAELSQVLEKAGHEARELLARRQQLATIRDQVEAELRSIERSEQSTRSALDEMRAREEALERLLQVVASKSRITANDDIRKYRGALPWPADGRVVQTFGRHFMPRYSTYTVCNGLRLEVGSGAAVKAVFPGVVAYARHFKGYGNMVVLDHGHGVYSLVAGLATIHVRLDQQVTMGHQLGLAPPPGEDGNLYLEIRVGEKPDDPRRWLQLKEGST